MKGLYFYKLVSSYGEDITKDCKLTVNEIDHNFITLKDADIKEFTLDKENGILVLKKNNGEEWSVDMSHFTTDLNVVYDSKCGELEIHHDGVVDKMTGLITIENLKEEVQAYLEKKIDGVTIDGTLVGEGTEHKPLGVNPLEKTSAYKKVTRLIDRTKGESLPSLGCNAKGDRYVTYEAANEYGYLYTFENAKKFVNDLGEDWKLPTKAEWDDMLNAIEACEEDRTHGVITCNTMLGKTAGKHLKSAKGWKSNATSNQETEDTTFDVDMEEASFSYDKPKQKATLLEGLDTYGFKVLPAGYGDDMGLIDYFTRRARFWTATVSHVSDVFIKRFDNDKEGVVQVAENPTALASVRLYKEYDGKNFQEFVVLNGITYEAVLMPSLKSKLGYNIWLKTNLAESDAKYKPVSPNNGEIEYDKFAYYMCEWDGFSWKKKKLDEGDSIVIEYGVDDDTYEEYRLINGELVNIEGKIKSEIYEKYDNVIFELNARVDLAEREIQRLNDTDIQIWNALNQEVINRESVDAQQWEAINNEMIARENIDKEIWAAIEIETEDRTSVDSELWEAINTESIVREEVDNQQWTAINNEMVARETIDNQQWEVINAEIERSTAEDTYIKGRLISKEGCTFDCANGVLTLVTDNPENTIVIELDSNYGTF